jgi:hypothetical protein
MAFRQRLVVKDGCKQRPINQNGLGIVRSPYIKQLMFCNAFISLKNISQGRIENNFEFYESFFLHVYIP